MSGIDVLINNRYRLGSKLGAGSFGEIFVATDIHTAERFAAKVELRDTRHPQLFYEYKVYKSIKRGMGVPKVYFYGVTDTVSVMIMDVLGQSLEGVFNLCSRKFTMKTILMLAIQLVDRIEYLHGNNFLHRDIKPDNFLIGSHPMDSHVVYMVDMGLCKRFRDYKTRRHIPFRTNKKLTGTPRYASINTHNGAEQGRRDDLESLGYLLMYFNRGSLPWQGLKANTKQEKYDLIGQKKSSTTVEELCKGYPREFATYLKYCTKLSFSEKPDYFFLKSLFDTLFRKQGYEYDWIFDWDDLPSHEQFLARLNSSKLRRSPSETGRAQLIEDAEKLQEEHNEVQKQCEELKTENLRLAADLARLQRLQTNSATKKKENQQEPEVEKEAAPVRKRKRTAVTKNAST